MPAFDNICYYFKLEREAVCMCDIKSIAAECLGLTQQEMHALTPDDRFDLLERDRQAHGTRKLKSTVKPRGNMLAILGKTTRSENYTERARQISSAS